MPTITAEVFDGEGTLAIMVDGLDVVHLRVALADGAELTTAQHQAIIDAVVGAIPEMERRYEAAS